MEPSGVIVPSEMLITSWGLIQPQNNTIRALFLCCRVHKYMPDSCGLHSSKIYFLLLCPILFATSYGPFGANFMINEGRKKHDRPPMDNGTNKKKWVRIFLISRCHSSLERVTVTIGIHGCGPGHRRDSLDKNKLTLYYIIQPYSVNLEKPGEKKKLYLRKTSKKFLT